MWQKLKAWKDEARAKRGLDVGEVFYRLSGWQRAALVLSCCLCAVAFTGPTFSANVFPHIEAIYADGRFNVGELVSSIYLIGAVVGISVSPLLLMLPLGWFNKAGLILASLLIAYTNIVNACGTQAHVRAVASDAPRQKIERIHRLDAKIDGLSKAFQQVPAHQIVTAGMLKAAEDEAETLKKSAYAECNSGPFGMTRGPRCAELERKRDARLDEVGRFEAGKALTERAATIEAELWKAKQDRDAEGAAPEHVHADMEVFVSLLALLHLISAETATALTANKAATDAVTMELMAFFLTPASVVGVFKVFALFTSHKGEADRRMIEVAAAAAEARARDAIAAVEHCGTPNAPANDDARMEPDHSPEAVLGIEGEALPAFAHNPETVAEAAAAAMLKADPHKTYGRKARKRKAASRDSVRQWHREMVIKRPGCATDSTRFRSSYEAWCDDMNVAAVNSTLFGIVLRDEFGIEKKGSGRIRYLDVDLRPAAMRVVS